MSVGRHAYDSYDPLYTDLLYSDPLYGELYDPLYRDLYGPLDPYYAPFRIPPSSLATDSLQDHHPRLGQILRSHQPGLRPSSRGSQNRVRQNLLQPNDPLYGDLHVPLDPYYAPFRIPLSSLATDSLQDYRDPLQRLRSNLRDLQNRGQHHFQRNLNLLYENLERSYRMTQLALQLLEQNQNLLRSRHSFLNSNSGNNSGMVNPSMFQTLVDFKDFKENEVDIRFEDGSVVVSAKHEQRTKENGLITRSFFRRCKLPEDVDVDKLTSTFSPDRGVLIRAPRKMKVPPEIVGGRIIPIDIEHSQIVENGMREKPIPKVDPENVKK